MTNLIRSLTVLLESARSRGESTTSIPTDALLHIIVAVERATGIPTSVAGEGVRA